MPVTRGAKVHAWVDDVPVEPDVWKQVENLAAVPGVEHIAIMPDAHIGKGACVGSAILTRDVVIPAAVGVDIGCGMLAAPLSVRQAELGDLHRVRTEIERRVPVGRTNHGQAGDRGAWGRAPDDVAAVWKAELLAEYSEMVRKYPDLKHQFTVEHLGTLGTGNHFIEICIEEGTDSVWLMLHSGSRGIGNKIGTYFMRRAQPAGPDLGFLDATSELARDYMRYAEWAQHYAWQNRLVMFRHVLEALGTPALAGDVVHCHHNYIARESHFGRPGLLTRKGAVNADAGVLGIIPGSMGARSYITRGLGNELALRTSSHGAGRVMSRNVARKTITMQQHLASMQGVEARTDADVLDESPAAYKPIDAVMAAQAELTQPIHTLKQIVVVKG